jgi:hypothetical protein
MRCAVRRQTRSAPKPRNPSFAKYLRPARPGENKIHSLNVARHGHFSRNATVIYREGNLHGARDGQSNRQPFPCREIQRNGDGSNPPL